jgi:hypothetical protein
MGRSFRRVFDGVVQAGVDAGHVVVGSMTRVVAVVIGLAPQPAGGGVERRFEAGKQGGDLRRLKHGRLDQKRRPLARDQCRVRLDEPLDLTAIGAAASRDTCAFDGTSAPPGALAGERRRHGRGILRALGFLPHGSGLRQPPTSGSEAVRGKLP